MQAGRINGSTGDLMTTVPVYTIIFTALGKKRPPVKGEYYRDKQGEIVLAKRDMMHNFLIYRRDVVQGTLDSVPEPSTRIKVENLVVLKYAPNECYVQVADFSEHKDEIGVDLVAGRWSWKEWKSVGLGQARNPYNPKWNHKTKSGVIGVYDRTNVKHLDSLAHASLKFTKSEVARI